MASLHPPLKWAQRKDRIFLTIELRDVKNEKIELKDKELFFLGSSDSLSYECKLTLFAEVDPQDSKWVKNDLHIQFILMKKDKTAAFWKRLVEEDKKNSMIQADWSKYIDEDEEETEAGKGLGGPGGDWDPEMMNRFGGGGMGGMPEDGDSDDEDEKGEKLPDLDKEEELPGTEGKKHHDEEKKCEEGCEHHHH